MWDRGFSSFLRTAPCPSLPARWSVARVGTLNRVQSWSMGPRRMPCISYQPTIGGVADGLRAGLDLKLAVNAAHMRIHGPHADAEPPSDLGTGVARGHHLQHVALTTGEFHAVDVARLPGIALVEPVQQAPRETRCDRSAPIDHLQHRLREIAEPGVLDQVARGAQLKSMQHLRFVFDRGDHHHFDSRSASLRSEEHT